MKGTPRYTAGHTNVPGECKWGTARERISAPRAGAHPRPGRRKATSEPTAGLPGNLGDIELGQDVEEQVDRDLEEAKKRSLQTVPPTSVPSASGATSSTDPNPPMSSGNSSTPAVPAGSTNPGTSVASTSAGPLTEHGKRKAAESQRDKQKSENPSQPRKKWADTGVQGDAQQDWTRFDLGRILRTFRYASPGQCRLTLRKLHLRWWHAQTTPMQKLLKKAGAPEEIIDMVPDIVDTCAACRTWSKPLPDAQASVEIADTFNYQVECDLLFVYKYIVFHAVDRCTRWHQAVVVENRKAETLVAALDSWVALHGPMTELLVDGERGLVISQVANDYCTRKGIKIVVRAPQQHARIIERRGALLRDAIHRNDEQLKLEGITGIPFEERLSNCVFAGNAMISINDTSPYNAVYGRSPNLLPSLEFVHDDGELKTPSLKQIDRIREIAVASMVEGTANSRILRALSTRTLPPGELQHLQVGDEV